MDVAGVAHIPLWPVHGAAPASAPRRRPGSAAPAPLPHPLPAAAPGIREMLRV